ncbi:DUF6193 family natural product biosynthesis protein [Streptomyces anulatus]|nr:DUF6193 family natural product biosynthesis protein [Streptomyces sp. CB00072]
MQNSTAGLVPGSEPRGTHLHRNTHSPWSNDLPFIVGDAQLCIVHAPLSASPRVLGDSLTPNETAALVVAHLPNDCGPAFEGPGPQPRAPPTDKLQSSSRPSGQTALKLHMLRGDWPTALHTNELPQSTGQPLITPLSAEPCKRL